MTSNYDDKQYRQDLATFQELVKRLSIHPDWPKSTELTEGFEVAPMVSIFGMLPKIEMTMKGQKVTADIDAAINIGLTIINVALAAYHEAMVGMLIVNEFGLPVEDYGRLLRALRKVRPPLNLNLWEDPDNRPPTPDTSSKGQAPLD